MDDIKNYINKNYILKEHLFQKIKENITKILKLLYQCKKQEFQTNMI